MTGLLLSSQAFPFERETSIQDGANLVIEPHRPTVIDQAVPMCPSLALVMDATYSLMSSLIFRSSIHLDNDQTVRNSRFGKSAVGRGMVDG